MNDGILEAHRTGILTSTTLMACAPAFEHAAQLARENPTLDVGCHLVLIGGVSLLPPHDRLPASIGGLMRAVAAGRLRLHEELRAQVRRILDAGLTPSHLDTHKHSQMLPPVAQAVGRLAREFNIRWVRRPMAVPVLGAGLRWILRRQGCRMTDHFAGYRLTGLLDTPSLASLIRSLPEGTTELMCHPGYLREELRAAPTRLKESREREFRALVSPEARQAVLEAGVQLTNYRALAL